MADRHDDSHARTCQNPSGNPLKAARDFPEVGRLIVDQTFKGRAGHPGGPDLPGAGHCRACRHGPPASATGGAGRDAVAHASDGSYLFACNGGWIAMAIPQADPSAASEPPAERVDRPESAGRLILIAVGWWLLVELTGIPVGFIVGVW